MNDADLLKIVRDGIEGAVKNGNLTQDMTAMFLLLKILDMLQSIDETLGTMMSEQKRG